MSQWNDFVPPEQILETTKSYLGKYLYHAIVIVPGLSFLHLDCPVLDKNDFVTEFENTRDRISKNAWPMWNTLYASSIVSHICHKHGNGEVLFNLMLLLEEYHGKVRTSRSMSGLHVYTENEQMMHEFLTRIMEISDDRVSVKSISQPRSQEMANKLLKNVIFQKNPKYKFKVVIKEGRYDTDSLATIRKHFRTIPETDIHIPVGLRRRLKINLYQYGYYFVNDLLTTTFINIVDSRFVSKIYSIEQLPNK